MTGHWGYAIGVTWQNRDQLGTSLAHMAIWGVDGRSVCLTYIYRYLYLTTFTYVCLHFPNVWVFFKLHENQQNPRKVMALLPRHFFVAENVGIRWWPRRGSCASGTGRPEILHGNQMADWMSGCLKRLHKDKER